MYIHLHHGDQQFRADMAVAHDISLPLEDGERSSRCFYAPFLQISPVVAGNFTGSIKAGAPVNFMDLRINVHGNGTHTECVGHISDGDYTMDTWLNTFMFPCMLISVYPEKQPDGDRVITADGIREALAGKHIPPALAIRTLPNSEDKMWRNYSGSNPPYFQQEAMSLIAESGVNHLLTDLPSVDREEDGGKLLAHHAFWFHNGQIRHSSTITELIFVKNEIIDGLYVLNLQFLKLCMDASPSRPVLYPLQLL